MKVTLLGSTGFVGKILLGKLLDAGHDVKVLVRNTSKLGDLAGRVTVVEGNFFRGEDIDAAIEEAEAVMSTIGPSRGERSAEFADDCILATEHLLRSLKEQGLKRLILMAGAGMPLPGEKLHLTRRLMATTLKMIARAAWAGKVREMTMAFESGLDVTVIRPPMIKDSISGDLGVDETRLGGVRVDVNQVAQFMINQLTGTDWIGRAPVVWTKRAVSG
jgi:nucleoside-diphosphate-sugar epimerase